MEALSTTMLARSRQARSRLRAPRERREHSLDLNHLPGLVQFQLLIGLPPAHLSQFPVAVISLRTAVLLSEAGRLHLGPLADATG